MLEQESGREYNEKQLPPLEFREGLTEFQIPAAMELKQLEETYVPALERTLEKLGWDERDTTWTGLAFLEGVQNAIWYGSLGLTREDLQRDDCLEFAKAKQASADAQKRGVYIRTDLGPKKIQIIIEDEGNGKLDMAKLTPDPTSPNNLIKGEGRGGFFINEAFGKAGVKREKTETGGLRLTLTKTRE